MITTERERAQTVDLLRFAQWALLDHAKAIDASRAIIGRPVTIASNAAQMLRERASIAADIIERLESQPAPH